MNTREKKNILVFPCGSEVAHEIYRSLRYSKDFRLIGGSSVEDHGRFVFENYTGNLPFVDDETFIDELNRVIEKNKISYIFPAHDSAVLKLAQCQKMLKAEVVTASSSTCEVARSKRKTYETLGQSVRVPKIFSPDEVVSFPVFLKPDVGQGSKGVVLAENTSQLQTALDKDPSLLILEYLPGQECTVDCFTDRHGKLLFAQARTRDRIVNGISVNSKSFNDPLVLQIAEKINKKIGLRGVWFFQLKKSSDGEYTLLEFAPRVAGTMALSRMAGANLPLLSLYDRLGLNLTIIDNGLSVEIDRALSSKYKLNIDYETVYVDFDDTVVVDGKVNELLMAFLYKCANAGKQIILITKHLEDISEGLTKYAIAPELFKKIISLAKIEEKNPHVSGNAIFIDDSFAERKMVHEKTGVPVFDVSEAVELP